MEDLFGEKVQISIPARFEFDGRVGCARIQKYARLKTTEQITLSPYTSGSLSGLSGELDDKRVLIVPRKTTAAADGQDLLLIPEYSTPEDATTISADGYAQWLRPKPVNSGVIPREECTEVLERVRTSWKDSFSFNEEIRDDAGIIAPGLRSPQIGALYATLAHWSVSSSPATIVMPTGTGKTETMLALLTAGEIERVMVVVPPSSRLRDQIASKFLTLGILKAAGVLPSEAETPVVATLMHRPTSPEEVDEIFLRANVIVTTMNIAGQIDPGLQERMAEHCSHLFIDEAHHIAAKTWRGFKEKFSTRRVVQFTATPFRTDGKRVDGKFIYVYPLKKAQDEKYFTPISFQAVQGLEQREADREIAQRVVRQLRADLSEEYDHLVIARAKGIPRAETLLPLYREIAPEFKPVCIHSRQSKFEQQQALEAISNRESRIIVCVDMFGEGFDLPNLKIAGIHDRHKSVAATLQFTGRFTRDSQGIGDATVIANIEQDDIDDTLRSLYAEEADWNFLLRILSEGRTGRQVRRAEVLEGFTEQLPDIPLQTLLPRMSTVVYTTTCAEWRPQNIEEAFPIGVIYAGPVLNETERLAVFVTRDEAAVRWSSTKTVVDVEWNLYLVHWDVETKLLYINSSKTKDLHERLAKAVGGESANRIRGESVYRVLHGINRLMLSNLGLSSALGRRLRYTMFIGTDITTQIQDAAYRTKRKSNLFGLGFDGDGKVTIGCSAKGKLWSHQVAGDFSEWMEWSRAAGRKLTDETIATDGFIQSLVLPEVITDRPPQPAIAIHWPDSLLIALEEQVRLRFGESDWIGFYECEIDIVGHEDNGPLRFSVKSEEHSATFEVRFNDDFVNYPQIDGPVVTVGHGGEKTLSEFFGEDSPHIYFADGNFLIFNELFKLPQGEERRLFSEDKIETRSWTGVDLHVESQGIEKRPDSIQRAVIADLVAADLPYDVVFDDDGTGEIADVVAMRTIENDRIEVHLFHCKYAHSAEPGNRVRDLYDVCGQAQKSIRWGEYPVRVLKRMRKRENNRTEAGLPSRFEQGDLAVLREWIGRWREIRWDYHIWIVQPGISKTGLGPNQLDLLAATESFLMETYGMPLRAIVSE